MNYQVPFGHFGESAFHMEKAKDTAGLDPSHFGVVASSMVRIKNDFRSLPNHLVAACQVYRYALGLFGLLQIQN
jgi:hypothetical protein